MNDDTPGLEQPRQPAHEPVNDLVLAGEGGRPIERGFGRTDTELLGPGDGLVDRCRLEPCLCRNAPADQARAADPLLLDERDGEPEVVGVERGGVAAGSPTDDDDVVHRSLQMSPGRD